MYRITLNCMGFPGGRMITAEVMQRIEQVSEVLACAQDYDPPVLADLHRWFNHLFRQSCRSAKMEAAAVSAAAARIVERMLLVSMQVPADNYMTAERTDREEIKRLLVNEVDVTLHREPEKLESESFINYEHHEKAGALKATVV